MNLLVKMILACLIVSTFLIMPQPVSAVELEPEGTAARQLQRGGANVILAPLELVEQLSIHSKDDTFPPGWAYALGKGSVLAVERAATGILELLTLPFTYPKGEAPLLEPEFASEYLEPKKE